MAFQTYVSLFKQISRTKVIVHMEIGKAIKQKKFINAQHKAHINIIYTAAFLLDQTKEVLKPFKVTHQQFNVLRILKGKYSRPSSAHEIKEVMMDKGPDLTRLLDRLIEKGWVQRTVCEENRRKIDVLITEAGIKLLEDIEPHLQEKFKGQQFLSEEEAEHLSFLLDKMRG